MVGRCRLPVREQYSCVDENDAFLCPLGTYRRKKKAAVLNDGLDSKATGLPPPASYCSTRHSSQRSLLLEDEGGPQLQVSQRGVCAYLCMSAPVCLFYSIIFKDPI